MKNERKAGTIVDRALETVGGFMKVHKTPEQQTIIKEKSKSIISFN